jgi:hypothetical protein
MPSHGLARKHLQGRAGHCSLRARRDARITHLTHTPSHALTPLRPRSKCLQASQRRFPLPAGRLQLCLFASTAAKPYGVGQTWAPGGDSRSLSRAHRGGWHVGARSNGSNGSMLKDPASIALAALFAFLGILISIYQVRSAPQRAGWRAAQDARVNDHVTADDICRTPRHFPSCACLPADTLPPQELHRASVPGAPRHAGRARHSAVWSRAMCVRHPQHPACMCTLHPHTHTRRGTSSASSSWSRCMP